ncbi:MAG: peptidase C69 [Candidatus Schekmanbacteria bacterium RIFCSPHIGHO2_02_FULL_38_11]|uniref:Peptidase C69 n=1 Tax=Candidatus Schekmanbacteria bacterium RIFCSPLOWO2_12_FULL_38_15 TaxID=1817883 RepID=A0A1F7SGG5_9BACT|nr:MAG: peptidase C69 [Candidatus Schekmanbacteria bacterium GWA2_38_9]OGL48920.1 MAG: peptidase C69 [Candidatus Schekmanbacteria bacterium RIFCSPHIGHO2_02_FULL_38_11]OGL49930.1 MAG: peptidase C69 [Candidatus Schekmanbacteria bacterium RIFCSPLOWO2_02_FULL_38_14]OGL52880.1 MAG: peptidase C69 [Candidatus Schekmanbacteria bacterium RIFCSPLOWO2_12_FULL_38_15]
MSEIFSKIDCGRVLREALLGGGEFADVFLEMKQTTSIIMEDNKIEEVLTGFEQGAGIRVISDFKTFYAYTNNLTEKDLFQVASALKQAVSSGKSDIVVDLSRSVVNGMGEIEKHPESITTDRKVEIVKNANEWIPKGEKRIRQAKIVYGDSIQQMGIANSEGMAVTDERVNTIFLVQIVAGKDGIIQTGYEPAGGSIGFELFDSVSTKDIARKALERAFMMLEAQKAPGGEMPVVISSEAGGTMVHEAVGHGLEGDFNHERISVYSGKTGSLIASPLVTVVDDSTIPKKRGSFRFDDEGVRAQRTMLIENGVLKNFLYDRLTAMKDGKTSTGNGRRQSFRYKPIPRMTNTLIVPGRHNPEEIISSTENGLFVRKMGGGQVNPTNGEFVFEVSEGYLIENGRVTNPVRGATLAGNGPQVLRDIDMVGNDLGFAIGTCGKDGQGAPVADAQPTLRIKKLVVGGEGKPPWKS